MQSLSRKYLVIICQQVPACCYKLRIWQPGALNNNVKTIIIKICMSWEFAYELVYYLQTLRHKQIYLPSFLQLANACIHLLIFLSLPPIAIITLKSFATSLILFIVLACLSGVVLLQIVVLATHKKQFYLLQQLYIFRFILCPFLLLVDVQLVKAQTLPAPLGTAVLIFAEVFASVLSQLVLFQNFKMYSIKPKRVYVVTQWLSFELLLIALSVIENKKTQLVLTFLLLLLATNIFYHQFYTTTNTSFQNQVIYLITLLHCIMALLLVLQQVLNQISLPPAFYLCSAILLAYLVIRVRISPLRLQKKVRKILQLEGTYAQFVQFVDYFIQIYRENEQKVSSEFQKFIIFIYHQHGQTCAMPSCQFMTFSSQQELKNLTSRSIQQLALKVQKKIQWIFDIYCQQNSDDSQYILDFLTFYAFCFHNRVKFQKVLASLDLKNCGFDLGCQYYKFKKICEEIENKENIDVAKVDEVFVEFESNLLSTLTLMHQFWAQFFEQKVDLKRIMAVSSKLFPYKTKIEEMAKKQLQNANFTSFKILRLYVLYLKMILNHQQLALKLEDHLKITIQRLKDSQNIKYLSLQTEAGFIVICLSQSKLGNIFLVNERACNIFRYNKKDILQQRVNAIMPRIYAVLHDKILTDFLKTKRRKYTTDQRLLFGKDGSGYMFPVQLQLQNTSFTSNDEYIFIAMVKPDKTREIPIYCIVDHQGYIRDYTASFKNIFYFQSKKEKAKNIQEIIPNYFDDDYSEEMRIARTLSVPINNKKLGEIEARFEITPIIIKESHEGFLVKMSYISNNSKFNSRTYRFTDKIMELKINGELSAFQNCYNAYRNSFQISKHKTMSGEFDLAFQNTVLDSQLDNQLLQSRLTQKPKYGANIKTIRFIKNHFERIEDQDSFHSQIYDDDFKLDIKAKIDSFKQNSEKKETKALVTSFMIALNIVIFVILVDLAVIYGVYQTQINQELDYLQRSDYDKQTRYYLPQYIIYNSLYSANINQAYYFKKMVDLQPTLVTSLVNSPFNQNQKEQVYKIIYMRQTTSLDELLNSNVISVTIEDTKVQSILYLAWGIVMSCCGVLVFVVIGIIYKLNGTLFIVYTIFLELNQSSIRNIHQSCKKLIKLIQLHYNQSKLQEMKQQSGQKDEQNEIQKMKQFKSLQRSENRIYFLQMTLPLVLILAFSGVVMILSCNSLAEFQNYKTHHYNYFQAIPSTSSEFMKVILRTLYNQKLTFQSNFEYYVQQIEKNLVEFQKITSIYDFLSVLYGNVCNNTLVVTSNHTLTCVQVQNGILMSGIAPALNYLNQQFQKISLTSVNGPAQLLSLLELQYMFVNPILTILQDKMEATLKDYIQKYGYLYQSLTVAVAGLFIVYSLYLCAFPLKKIENQIKFTNGMIALMPEHSMDSKKGGHPSHAKSV